MRNELWHDCLPEATAQDPPLGSTVLGSMVIVGVLSLMMIQPVLMYEIPSHLILRSAARLDTEEMDTVQGLSTQKDSPEQPRHDYVSLQ